MKTPVRPGSSGPRRRVGLALVAALAFATGPGRGQSSPPPGPPSAAVVPAVAAAPLPPLPLTVAQQAVLQGSLAKFVTQFAAATGIRLIPIPAGTFTMGSDPEEADRDRSEGPPTRVTLTKDFFLGATDVTQGQYEALMGKNPANFIAAGKDAPVENVSWDDGMAFCQKLNEQERAAGRLPAGWALTLPTEAQWEYARREGTNGPVDDDPDATAWYAKNSGGMTHPVATKRPNAWGLYDLEGNVSQWCHDWFGPYHGSSVTDPKGPATGFYRIARGGRFDDAAQFCRAASRTGGSQGRRCNEIGFRIALVSGP
jgi:formylglycine-generating enzyme required for sulfatase activity